MTDTLETARRALAAKLPKGESTVGPYTVTLEACSDESDPARGVWVDCWVTSPGGGHTNSLALLSDIGEFDDGPKVSPAALDRLTRFAQKYGY